jgi:hypothetical protein
MGLIYKYQSGGRLVNINGKMVSTDSQDYKNAYASGQVMTKYGKDYIAPQLQEFTVKAGPSTKELELQKKYPYWDKLNTDQKQAFLNPSDKNINIRRAANAQGLTGQRTGEGVKSILYKGATEEIPDMIGEATGFNAARRIYNDPMGTLKGVGNTAADLLTYANPAFGMSMHNNPITGNPYWTGLEQTADVLEVLPGIGTLGKGVVKGGKMVKPLLGKSGQYLTTQTPLKDAYKLNPWAFKPNPEMGYRMLGTEGYQDAINSGVLRAKPIPGGTPTEGISLTRNTNRNPNTGKMQPALDRPYFADGFIDERYAADYMAAVNKADNNLVPIPTHKGIAPSQAGSIPLENAILYKKDWLKGYKPIETPKIIPSSSVTSSVDDVGKGLTQVSKPAWQMQEMPGLHLKSTMSDGAISKIVEPKTGLVNVEQALAIIGKESGGADKVALIKQGLGDNIPKKMDFNDFRKTVQNQLIPLDKQTVGHASDYGLARLGYGPEEFVTKEVDGKKIHTYETDYLENQSIVLSNKGRFGRGSSAHGNPEETLGHAHYVIDKESPDVFTITQIQSDAFQGTHRIMPKTFNKEQELKSLAHMEDIAKRQKEYFDNTKLLDEYPGKVPNHVKYVEKWYQGPDGQIISENVYLQGSKLQEQANLLKKAEIENFTQKQLLDKNHQERYLQELVDYAGKRGDVSKVRVPTSETAAKVQGYSKVKIDDNSLLTSKEFDELVSLNEKYSKMPDNLSDDLWDNVYDPIRKRLDEINKKRTKETNYSSEHQTILKKYSEQPKTIKKLFGEEPKIVTDNKGNTWYEFDIPKKFKEGKGEIKAFTTTGAIIGTGAATHEYRRGGILKRY